MSQADLRARLYHRYRSSRGLETDSRSVRASGALFYAYVVARHFPRARSARILDLGAGQGMLIRAARAAGYTEVSGVDASSEQVAAAHTLGVGELTHGDVLEELRLRPAGCMEVVTTLDVIEHLTADEILALADDVHRVLAHGGRWIIHTVNAASPFFGRVRYGDFTHERGFTPAAISQVVRVAGFAAVECFEDRPLVHGPVSLLRRGLWLVIRSALWFCVAVETGVTEAGIFSQNLLAVAYKGRSTSNEV